MSASLVVSVFTCLKGRSWSQFGRQTHALAPKQISDGVVRERGWLTLESPSAPLRHGPAAVPFLPGARLTAAAEPRLVYQLATRRTTQRLRDGTVRKVTVRAAEVSPSEGLVHFEVAALRERTHRHGVGFRDHEDKQCHTAQKLAQTTHP